MISPAWMPSITGSISADRRLDGFQHGAVKAQAFQKGANRLVHRPQTSAPIRAGPSPAASQNADALEHPGDFDRLLPTEPAITSCSVFRATSPPR